MGYMLSSLGNLPVQEDISLYIFVVNGRWSDEFDDLIEKMQKFADDDQCFGDDCKNDSAQCEHEWGTDGQHQNEFCKKCYMSKP